MRLVEPFPGGWVSDRDFDALLARHDYRALLRAGGTVKFCFQDTTKVPAHVGLWLLSLFNQLACVPRGRMELEFAPASPLLGYLDRNGWLALLDSRVLTTPERPNLSAADLHRGRAAGLVEVTALPPGAAFEQVRPLVPTLVDKLVQHYPPGRHRDRLERAVFTVVAELVQNVYLHSETMIAGYAMLQAYPNASRPRVQIAVSDSGVGIPNSLRAAVSPRLRSRSDAQLIIEACQKGLSRHGADSGRGCGLQRCAQLAAKYGASIVVRTPATRVMLRPLPDLTMLRALVETPGGLLAGTHYAMEFRIAQD
jgi:hypothetical protein